MLTVACVQVGNYLGMGEEYVRRLKSAVEQHLTLPHRFVCLTDQQMEGIECLPARYPGWWEKLHIFKPGMFEGRVMFFDLDTFIVGSLDDLAAYDGDFCCPHDFFVPQGLGPAVILFDPKWAGFIWEEWAAEGFPTHMPRGDQGWIENRNQGRMRKEIDIMQERFPGQVYSYKAHCTSGIPPRTRVICFHGKPRPHEAKGWAGAFWKEAAPWQAA
jgi:hypothetical protein